MNEDTFNMSLRKYLKQVGVTSQQAIERERRAFVIEDAEAMAEESQNALLKTLEEPPPFAHLVLISAEPEALLETVRSRCRLVRFARLGPEAVEARLAGHEAGPERRTAARLSGGDAAQAHFLLTAEGRELRAGAEALARAVRTGELAEAPWVALAQAADAAGEREAGEVRDRSAALEADAAERSGPAARKRAREAEDAAKRAARWARNSALDVGLGLFGAWMRDLAAVAEGGGELILNADRATELADLAEGLDPRRARRAAELAMETRRRLTVNVNETLALEALAFRVEYLLAR